MTDAYRGADEGDELIDVLLTGLSAAGDLGYNGQALLLHSHALTRHSHIHRERRQTARPDLFAKSNHSLQLQPFHKALKYSTHASTSQDAVQCSIYEAKHTG